MDRYNCVILEMLFTLGTVYFSSAWVFLLSSGENNYLVLGGVKRNVVYRVIDCDKYGDLNVESREYDICDETFSAI